MNIVSDSVMLTKDWHFYEVSYLEPGEIGHRVSRFANFVYATHVPALCDIAIDLVDYEIQTNQVRVVREERPSGELTYFVDGQVCFHRDEAKLVVVVKSPGCETLEDAIFEATATITAVQFDGRPLKSGRGLKQRLITTAADLFHQHGGLLPETAEVIVPYWSGKGRGGHTAVIAKRHFAASELN
ncbi:MAG: hypothetical protein H6658_02245 [Ardenticatenaceae bacterium]|nr:hypothetical protein [Ardenticatenaceae bacterium]